VTAGFNGFPVAAFDFLERVQPDLPWATVQGWHEEWAASVHQPMEELLAALAPEFGEGYAWHLHRDPWLWRHQVAGVAIADTIALSLMLSVEGLRASGGWERNDSRQVSKYRQAVSAEDSGSELTGITNGLADAGFSLVGQRLVRGPAGFPADHPRLALARYRTLTAGTWVDADAVTSPQCLPTVVRIWRQLQPLTNWMAKHIGPREGRE
jgi:hypothetical protein